MSYGYRKHTLRIGSSQRKGTPFVWNGSAWVEHPAHIWGEITNCWLYNKGDENVDITGGWITEGWHFREDHYGVKTPLGLTKNANSMTITNNSAAVYDGDSGIVHITEDADLTPYSVLRFRVDYKMVNCAIVLGAMPKGSALYASNAGANVTLTGEHDVTGAEITVDVSALKGAYDICIGMVAWASNNSITVYEVELR